MLDWFGASSAFPANGCACTYIFLAISAFVRFSMMCTCRCDIVVISYWDWVIGPPRVVCPLVGHESCVEHDPWLCDVDSYGVHAEVRYGMDPSVSRSINFPDGNINLQDSVKGFQYTPKPSLMTLRPIARRLGVSGKTYGAITPSAGTSIFIWYFASANPLTVCRFNRVGAKYLCFTTYPISRSQTTSIPDPLSIIKARLSGQLIV